MNLYQIEQDLMELINTLEEQGGEFTEDQLAQLECTQENFKEKLQNYYYFVKNCQSDITECKSEEKRIKDIRKVKENKVEKLKSIMLDAVTHFGNIQNNGVKTLEYSTFKLSTRKSTSIEINEERINDFIRLFRNYCEELQVMCSLNNLKDIDVEGMIGAINAIYRAEWEHDGKDITMFTQFTIEDFNCIQVKIETKVNLCSLFSDIENESLVKAIVDNPCHISVVNDTAKDDLKNLLDYQADITIANKVGNLTLQMK